MESTPGAAKAARNHVILPFPVIVIDTNSEQTPTSESIPPTNSHRQPARKPATTKKSPTPPRNSKVNGCVRIFPTGILSPIAMITITAMSNALTIRAIQRHTVAERLVIFMDGFGAGAESTSKAVKALIEKPNPSHRIHQFRQMRMISARLMVIR